MKRYLETLFTNQGEPSFISPSRFSREWWPWTKEEVLPLRTQRKRHGTANKKIPGNSLHQSEEPSFLFRPVESALNVGESRNLHESTLMSNRLNGL
ncbi:hypothetical protein CEXT_137461 [Caerostris extrusa]|uniref:Uncharacterized protein n=1 Tax=Caerostris extrusa TaxID=172846 RepID=A0AAV4TD90_CAEEX|nr:hypothetical protein CEXT_137461 [Caerostris extrusa]